MSYCIGPGCPNPNTSGAGRFCIWCGSQLLLNGRYRLLEHLERGGFGRTFFAIDETIPAPPRCVVKQFHFLDKNPENIEKATQLFRQESICLAELGKHPQIPTLFNFFEQEQRLYLVQELIEGKTLKRELQEGAFDESQIWELLRDLLPVLQFIHDHRVIHRDIKPENIIHRPSNFIQNSSTSGQFVLIDFGIAKQLTDTSFFHTGTAIGTQDYAAPEQARGRTVPASDLYSLGVTCICLLTRVPPLDMYDFGEQQWWWRQNLPRGKTVSDRLGQILDKLLQIPLKMRYQSANQVLQDLK